MVCPQCGTLNPDEREHCFRCEHSLSPSRIAEELACRRHPQTPATTECAVCGVPLCDACAIRVADVAYCPDCAAVPGKARSESRKEIVLSPVEMATYRHASFGWRLLAGIIDGCILLSGVVVLALLFWMLTGSPVGVPRAGGSNVLFWLLLLVGAGVFFVGCHISSGQTPGYGATDLLLVCEDGTALSPLDATVRYLISLLSGACLMLGYLWMIWDPEDQTWHDKAAHTIALRTADREEPISAETV